MSLAERYAAQTLALAERETDGWDWLSCYLHGDAVVVFHCDNGCPACEALAGA